MKLMKGVRILFNEKRRSHDGYALLLVFISPAGGSRPAGYGRIGGRFFLRAYSISFRV